MRGVCARSARWAAKWCCVCACVVCRAVRMCVRARVCARACVLPPPPLASFHNALCSPPAHPQNKKKHVAHRRSKSRPSSSRGACPRPTPRRCRSSSKRVRAGGWRSRVGGARRGGASSNSSSVRAKRPRGALSPPPLTPNTRRRRSQHTLSLSHSPQPAARRRWCDRAARPARSFCLRAAAACLPTAGAFFGLLRCAAPSRQKRALYVVPCGGVRL